MKSLNNKENKNILLFSGGLDSLIAYFYLDRPMALFIDMSQKYASIEEERVKILARKIEMNLKVEKAAFDFSAVERDDLVIPNRNVYLSLWASNYADNIWMAAVDGDYNHDKNPKIFSSMSKFYSQLKNRVVTVDSPFWKWTKTDMIKWYKDSGYSIDWLLTSYSCFLGNENHCGRCSSCLRRWLGMFNNDIEEIYEKNPLDWDVIPKYIERMLYGEQISDTEGRRKEFLKAMFKAGYHVPMTNIPWVEELRSELK